MAKTTDVLPYTELVERVREIARIASENDRSRARGAVNDVYARKVPSEEDWSFLLIASGLTCDRPLTDGTVSINTGTSVVTTNATSLGSANTGWRIKFSENPDLYTVTFVNTTTLTISPLLSEGVNIAGGAYTAFNPVYALAGDFDRFPKNGGLLFSQGGRMTPIPEVKEQGYYRDYTPSPMSVPRTCRLVQAGTEGLQYVELQPPPGKAYNVSYEYLKRPTIMRETTAGTATLSGGGTIVTFHGGARIGEMTTGMYVRVDAFGTGADSEWYRLIALSAANSTGTLQTAFAVSAAVSAGYTVCHAPEYPVKLQPAILYGAVTTVTADQNDPLFKFYDAKYREAITDGKRTFKTRIYKQEVESLAEEWQYRR